MGEGELSLVLDVAIGDVLWCERIQTFRRVAAETDKQALSVDDQLVYQHGLGINCFDCLLVERSLSDQVFEGHAQLWRPMGPAKSSPKLESLFGRVEIPRGIDVICRFACAGA